MVGTGVGADDPRAELPSVRSTDKRPPNAPPCLCLGLIGETDTQLCSVEVSLTAPLVSAVAAAAAVAATIGRAHEVVFSLPASLPSPLWLAALVNADSAGSVPNNAVSPVEEPRTVCDFEPLAWTLTGPVSPGAETPNPLRWANEQGAAE